MYSLDWNQLVPTYHEFVRKVYDPGPSLTYEVEKRLRQMPILIDLVASELAAYEARINSTVDRPTPDAPEDEIRAWANDFFDKVGLDRGLPAETAVECVYFIAWRLRDVLHRFHGPLKVEARGVLMVRNHLLEHPEKHQTANAASAFMATFPERDAFLRSGHDADVTPAFLDAGLITNVTEFYNDIREALVTAIAATI